MSGRAAAAAGLSAREAEVLAALADRRTNAEIAAQLFISVRTAETYVSTLLRKLGAKDRRELGDLATAVIATPGAGRPPRRPVLPAPLTRFVGREAERDAVASALRTERMVSIVGPGGAGKTRLALVIAAQLTEQFADGVWLVDLVRVSDPERVPDAVVSALGIGITPGLPVAEATLRALRDHEALLVFDNCEHLVDGVAEFSDRLLSECRDVRVLCTSRVRLLLPFEHVVPLGGLSLPTSVERGDAVVLFVSRARAAGATLTEDQNDRDAVAEICRGLDGMPLAIELAAARLPSLGLDGVRAGLTDHLRLLAGRRPAKARHESIRAAVDWSFELLAEPDRELFQRVTVFQAPFTPSDAAAVAGVDAGMAAEGLGRLAEHSMVRAMTGPSGTRYRMLETLRQYGTDQLDRAGHREDVRLAHANWCLTTVGALNRSADGDAASWRAAVDRVIDDLRAALLWTAERREHAALAFRLALDTANVAFARGLIGEARRCYEQAASVSDDPATTASTLRQAAGAAFLQFATADTLRLHLAAAEAIRRSPDAHAVARHLAATAVYLYRQQNMFSERVPLELADEMLSEARRLGAGDPLIEAGDLMAQVFRAVNEGSALSDVAARAVRLSAADPMATNVALDALCASQVVADELTTAAATAEERVQLVSRFPVDVFALEEMSDSYLTAIVMHRTTGQLASAREWAQRYRDLPYVREESHVASTPLIILDALAGRFDELAGGTVLFRDGWERAGRPRASSLFQAMHAIAMAFGLRGEEDARDDWLACAAELGFDQHPMAGTRRAAAGWRAVFDTILQLHLGRAESVMLAEPDPATGWAAALVRPWYAALWAETAVFARSPDAIARLDAARHVVAGNEVAAAIVDRSRAWIAEDRDGVRATAARFDAVGCAYQSARSLVLAGDSEGADRFQAMDVLSMVAPEC